VEPLVLFVILALLIFGPRRGGRRPGNVGMMLGGLLLLWLVFAYGLGWLWHAIVGDVAQP
jgi:hypothetical protein